MKQQTPIQELLEVIDQIKTAQPEDFSEEALSIRACMDTVIQVISDRKLVDKEKAMVVDTVMDIGFNGDKQNTLGVELIGTFTTEELIAKMNEISERYFNNKYKSE